MFDLSLSSLSNWRGKKPPTLPSSISSCTSLAGAAGVCPSSLRAPLLCLGSPGFRVQFTHRVPFVGGIHPPFTPLNDRSLNCLKCFQSVSGFPTYDMKASHGKVWETSGREWKLGERVDCHSLL